MGIARVNAGREFLLHVCGGLLNPGVNRLVCVAFIIHCLLVKGWMRNEPSLSQVVVDLLPTHILRISNVLGTHCVSGPRYIYLFTVNFRQSDIKIAGGKLP